MARDEDNYYDQMREPINNDDHPDDRGLHATQEDHWGTVHHHNFPDAEEPTPESSVNRASKSDKYK